LKSSARRDKQNGRIPLMDNYNNFLIHSSFYSFFKNLVIMKARASLAKRNYLWQQLGNWSGVGKYLSRELI
jgi:hypothetical protein